MMTPKYLSTDPNAGELVQEPSQEELENVQTEPVTSAIADVGAGAASMLWPGWDTIKRAATAAVNPLGGVISRDEEGNVHLGAGNLGSLAGDIGKGMYEGSREQGSKAWEDLKLASEAAGRMDYGDAAGRFIEAGGHGAAAALPGIGPAAARTGEDLATPGRRAYGVGEAAGLLLPSGIGAARPSAAVRASQAARAEQSAGTNMAKAVGATWKEAPEVAENARYLSEQTGVSASKGSMLKKIKGGGGLAKADIAPESLLGQAKTNLEKVKAAGAGIPIEFEGIEDELRATEPAITYPEGETGPATVDPKRLAAFNQWADKLEDIAKGFGEDIVTPGEPVLKESPIRGPKGEAIFDEVEGPSTKVREPGPVPASEAFKTREAAGRVAKRGNAYTRAPGMQATPSAEAAAATQAKLSKELKLKVPGLEKADLDYHSLRQAGDILQKAAQKEAVASPSAAKTFLGRMAIRGSVGATAAAAGAGVSSAAGLPLLGGALVGGGAYGAWKIAQEVLGSTWWNTLSAAEKLKYADAMRGGAFNVAHVAGEAAAYPVLRTKSQPEPPEEEE
jgi:hypothetical protein